PVFCLPGNPVAAFVCFRLIVSPALTAMQGGTVAPVLKLPLPARFSHGNKQGRTQYLRARIERDENGEPGIFIHGRPGAGVLSSLTGAHGLVEIPGDCHEVSIGDMLNFIPFREAAL
ncbi:MAG: molybdopterin molybdenumtransferase MoeA, partial [Candidatus Puniceispirillales bacterium]